VTSQILDRRRIFPGSGGSRRHTIPEAFATSIPATRSCRSWQSSSSTTWALIRFRAATGSPILIQIQAGRPGT